MATVKYWIIRPTDLVRGEPLSIDVDLTHARMGAFRELLGDPVVVPALGTRNYERVAVLHPDKDLDLARGVPPQGADMFVDEDGHARGLPFNPTASAIYRAFAIRAGRARAEDLPPIVGPAVLFDCRVWS